MTTDDPKAPPVHPAAPVQVEDPSATPATSGAAAPPSSSGFAGAAVRWRRQARYLPSRLRLLFVRWLALRESNLFLLLAVIIGLFSGLAVVCFRITIEYTRLFLLGSALRPPVLRLLLAPTLSGIGVAALVILIFPRVRGSGVNQTKAALYIYDGYVPFRTVIGKFLACALAIGSGQSLGPEDPSLQIGAGIASALGRKLRLSRDKVRLIAPVGAAAGLAAAFNAPVSAVIFVIEEIIGKWSAGVLGAIVLSAVSSVVVVRGFLGSEPLFRIPQFQLNHAFELIAYAVLGVVGGAVSVFFAKLVERARRILKSLPARTFYVQPALAGLAVGLVGIFLPQVMGAGYGSIDQAMHDQYGWQMLALLGIVKVLATTICFASGTPGGMFAPTLFVGAMIGGAVGGLEHHFFPEFGASVGPYALVGMGVMFAGFLRVPLTSAFMVLEVSGNYSIILPVMVSNAIAYLISRKYCKVPIFDVLSRQDGMDLPSMEEQREESPVRVEDAMRPPSGPLLLGSDTFAEAFARVEALEDQHFLINFGESRWGTVTKEMLELQINNGKAQVKLDSLPHTSSLPWLHPDQPLDLAMRLIHDRPLLPVISRANLSKVEGVVTLENILAAYHNSFAAGRARD